MNDKNKKQETQHFYDIFEYLRKSTQLKAPKFCIKWYHTSKKVVFLSNL